jgi:hypothetical protein
MTSNFCFALALWNDRDPILKERMFGLTGISHNELEQTNRRRSRDEFEDETTRHWSL